MANIAMRAKARICSVCRVTPVLHRGADLVRQNLLQSFQGTMRPPNDAENYPSCFPSVRSLRKFRAEAQFSAHSRHVRLDLFRQATAMQEAAVQTAWSPASASVPRRVCDTRAR